MVPGMGGHRREVEVLGQESPLGIAGRKVERTGVALRHTHDIRLRGAGLDLLVDLRGRSRDEEIIGPFAAGEAGFDLPEKGEISIVETGQVGDNEGRTSRIR